MLKLTEAITFTCTKLVDIFSILKNFEIIFCFLKKEHEFILDNHENKFTQKLISQKLIFTKINLLKIFLKRVSK